MRASASVLVVAALLSSGCSAIDRVNDALYEAGADVEPSAFRAVAKDCGVGIVAGPRAGRGVVVGPRTVLTVAHVLGDEKEVEVATSAFGWTKARVVGRIASSPEDLVRLELEPQPKGLVSFDGFEPERVVAAAAGEPAFVLTRSGIHGWARGLREGDSGSPVLDREGGLVGVLVGKTRGGKGVLAPVAPETKPDAVLLARAW